MRDDRVRFTRQTVLLPEAFLRVLPEFIECLLAYLERYPVEAAPASEDIARCQVWAEQARTRFSTDEAALIQRLIGTVDGAERLLHLGLRPAAAQLIDSVDVQLVAALEAVAHLSRTVHARNRVH